MDSLTIGIHVAPHGSSVSQLVETVTSSLDVQFDTVTHKNTKSDVEGRVTVVVEIEYNPAQYPTDTDVRSEVDKHAGSPEHIHVLSTETHYPRTAPVA